MVVYQAHYKIYLHQILYRIQCFSLNTSMYLEYLAFKVENVSIKYEVYDTVHSSATFQAVKMKYK